MGVLRCYHLHSAAQVAPSAPEVVGLQDKDCRLLHGADVDLHRELRQHLEIVANNAISGNACPFVDQRACPSYFVRSARS